MNFNVFLGHFLLLDWSAHLSLCGPSRAVMVQELGFDSARVYMVEKWNTREERGGDSSVTTPPILSGVVWDWMAPRHLYVGLLPP